ncbi:MAG: serine protease [Clostridia bacterium]|nr:serine protease [Clostridia bacterium]
MRRGIRFWALLLALLFVWAPALAEYRFSEDVDGIDLAADSVFMLEVYSARREKIAVGSGFVAFDASLLVTNYHVIQDAAYVVAVSENNKSYPVYRVCALDEVKDLAILQFEQKPGVSPLPLNARDPLKRAQPVVVISSPAGLMNTVSLGNISAFYNRENKHWIQFTAPISSGSSGGALLNDRGEVIGVVTATYASAQNVNMAVRIQDLEALYKRWDGRTTARLDSSGTVAVMSSLPVSEQQDAGVVWITRSGKKYHSTPTCSHMRSPVEISLVEAIANGYEPCGKCFK